MKINQKKIIGIVGLGYVGLPLLLLINKKFKVFGFDNSKAKIEMIKTPGKLQAWEKGAGAAKVFFSIVSNGKRIIDLEIRYKGSYTANPQFQAVATADFKAIFK